MSLGKLPGIKGLVSSSQGRRRFKSDLSVDMISPPLGDFRHTMHVGRGGDVFGDTSFLSNHGGSREAGPSGPESPTSASKTAGFFSRTLRHVYKTPAPRPREGSHDFSPPPPPVSPIIKNAISLPQLNMENGCLARALFPSSVSSPEDSLFTYGVQSGFVTLPRLSRLDKHSQDVPGSFSPDVRRSSLPDSGFGMARSDSLASFTIDLGPSLMSEVLGMIDSPGSLRASEEAEDGQSSVGTMVAESSASEDSPLRCCSPDWAIEGQDAGEGDGDSPVTAAVPVRVEPGMEAERFQHAADVLARHYGGGALLKGHQRSISPIHNHRGAIYDLPDDEEEIKV
ncbi:cdc42 effector protein 1b [Denticeps clupeoides]|uniref:cdc42 effector protein 1b n=1 Tax=Denticeps clupeoides TaxID=299321 RepID=UPI0010A2CFDB|nr:cdc42 effector protein 1-like [Denticeps clupeoides]XP_028842556.1 cdc42 effector protein 1-like [Denticeps clupeoides]XP_028842558.1 cdc42 effector protein 1-like [Denticeps clupeoides]